MTTMIRHQTTNNIADNNDNSNNNNCTSGVAKTSRIHPNHSYIYIYIYISYTLYHVPSFKSPVTGVTRQFSMTSSETLDLRGSYPSSFDILLVFDVRNNGNCCWLLLLSVEVNSKEMFCIYLCVCVCVNDDDDDELMKVFRVFSSVCLVMLCCCLSCVCVFQILTPRRQGRHQKITDKNY